ncbi:hypothetical protein ACS0PU_011250 [Formica fusca]
MLHKAKANNKITTFRRPSRELLRRWREKLIKGIYLPMDSNNGKVLKTLIKSRTHTDHWPIYEIGRRDSQRVKDGHQTISGAKSMRKSRPRHGSSPSHNYRV